MMSLDDLLQRTDWLMSRPHHLGYSIEDALTCVQVLMPNPSTIIDVGCGVGQMTVALAKRFSKARLMGIDSDKFAIEACRRLARSAGEENRCDFQLGSVSDFEGNVSADTSLFLAARGIFGGRDDLLIKSMRGFTKRGGIAVVDGAWSLESEDLLVRIARFEKALADQGAEIVRRRDNVSSPASLLERREPMQRSSGAIADRYGLSVEAVREAQARIASPAGRDYKISSCLWCVRF